MLTKLILDQAQSYNYHYVQPLVQSAARSTVPGGPSVACSTAKALEWDASWSKNPDPSGRAALGVHEAAYKEQEEAKGANPINGSS